MAKFRVWANCVSCVYLDVEADNANRAIEIAEQIDGGDFREDNKGGYFEITHAERKD